jgi:integrating conjugative element membrane protein (TIGR03747 family)
MMAESNTSVADRPRGFIAKTWEFLMKMVGVLIFSAFMSIIIEWIQIAYFYPEGTGYQNAKQMMELEMGYLTGDRTDAFSENEFIGSVSQKVNGAIRFLFIDSGLLSSVAGLEHPKPTGNKVTDFFRSIMADYYIFLVSAVYIFCTFLIRLGILVLSVPAFALFGIVGICDGLSQRDLRRWCGGNESGYVYHWAKKLTTPVIFAAWIIYLSMPYSIHPNFIITPFALLYGLVVMVMASKFKKYL